MIDRELKEVIKRCIREESEALITLLESIDDVDSIFLDYLINSKGNIIISGIGKSFSVGIKLAGTFASLGLSAVSIPATDMMHGNIGMIKNNDIVILISNSGETREVVELAKYLKIMNLGIVLSITGNVDSTIAKLSTLSKEIKVKEAGPFSVVPTSSTTAVMAYGDALATAYAYAKKITLSSFIKCHPSGSIGNLL